MPRRSRHNAESSLELLLDTITNTFGGVLFLAILLAILAQFRGDAALEQDVQAIRQADLLNLKNELADTRAELASLTRRRAAQQSFLEAFASDDLKDLAAKRTSATVSRDELIHARLESLERIAELQSQINETAEQLQELDQELEKARADLLVARKALQTEIASRTRTVELPRMRPASKTSFPIVMRYGKLYFLFSSPNAAFLRQVNFDDFMFVGEDADYVKLTPKPYRGLPVDEQELGALKQRLLRYSPATHYFAVAVWYDSFEEFPLLRTIFVDAGFEYRLLPISEDDYISEGHVPNPQVQ